MRVAFKEFGARSEIPHPQTMRLQQDSKRIPDRSVVVNDYYKIRRQ
jgi:hypothetical protein